MISQIAAEAAVRHAWSYPSSFHDQFRARRRLMDERLCAIPGLHWTPAAGGLFALVRVEGLDDADALAREMLESIHVVTIPGSAFGVTTRGHLRLSYGYAAPDDLEEALERLRLWFAARH